MNAETEMTLTEKVVADATILEVKGRINSANSKQFGAHMTDMIDNGCAQLIVDLKDLEFMTSAGFRALLIAGKAASKTQGQYVLCSLSEDTKRLFELGGFLDLFPIYEDSAAALDAIAAK